ncbi:hypothetical protein EJ04DRAFT_511071 [Polyplosphaeria fusca]|uniref:Uncharacterized protein n=1 Tax=Polyplosphaeria fusca TaxID=682080 RepID=A0A9P4R0L5_9PLEO|nr:hypothetical protein EJ04DRAFT_511071 [Polyplosphaeria fusca]
MHPIQKDLFSRTSGSDFVKLSLGSKCAILNAFWPHLQLDQSEIVEDEYAVFFDFIGKTLQSLYRHAHRFAAQDLDSLLSDVSDMRTNRDMTRGALTLEIQKRYLNTLETDVARSMELAARLWLGLNVCSRHLSIGPRNGRDSLVDWPDTQSLDEMIAAQFKRRGQVSPDNTSLDDSFTAANLKNICRLRIRWTDNLVDHLKLEGPRGQRSLTIYRHKLSLINHRKGPDPTMIPADILDEALRTLDLLFPFGDPNTDAFLDEEGIQFRIVAFAELPRATETDDFYYWRKNLVALSSLLNGPPETIAQTLLDTRNLAQFATLWVAIFGVFLLTILFGILSTVYSVKQYRVAVKSYELSLVLACQQSSAALPQFCFSRR